MKVILYNAISLDGFIATPDGDSEWVSIVDAEQFEKFCKDIGCIFVGRRTFEQYPDLYPMDGVVTIVLSTNAGSNSESLFFAKSVDEALKIASQQGFSTGILVGGAKINNSFLAAKVINEMYFSLHPLFLGEGIKVFELSRERLDLQLLEEKDLGGGVVQMHYKLNK